MGRKDEEKKKHFFSSPKKKKGERSLNVIDDFDDDDDDDEEFWKQIKHEDEEDKICESNRLESRIAAPSDAIDGAFSALHIFFLQKTVAV